MGQLSTPLNKRFNNQKLDIKNHKFRNEYQEIEIAHFEDHGIQNIRISRLIIVPNKWERMMCEIEVIIKYGVVYSYGLNVIYIHIL